MHHVLDVLAKMTLVDFLDILIVAYIFYQLFMLIKDTLALQVLRGLIVIIAVTFLAQAIGLETVRWLMRGFWVVGLVAGVVVFQPELRSILAKIGRGPFRRVFVKERRRFIEEITKAARNFSQKKVGALIAVQQRVGLGNIIETGTVLNAELSADLLETIFMPGTLLHDGAVIVQDNKIVAAGCLLPLTMDTSLSRVLATRHRAAVGLSEVSDAVIIVVSEENGTISVAKDGKLLRDLEISTLEKMLMELYQTK
ncbi:MAG: diadenylate cyclase CdaA [bacterium]